MTGLSKTQVGLIQLGLLELEEAERLARSALELGSEVIALAAALRARAADRAITAAVLGWLEEPERPERPEQ